MEHQERLTILLEKLRQQGCSKEELKELKKLTIENSGRNLEQYLDEDLIQQPNHIAPYKSEQLWQSISNKTGYHTPAVGNSIMRKLSVRLIAAAAVVGLLFFAGYQLFDSKNELTETTLLVEHSGSSDPKLVQLSDGSKVWLNELSRLSFPAEFTDEKREVTLIGQAYFEVAHDPTKPFSVIANQLTTTVLGTSFDINANAKNDVTEVALFTGMVEVTSETGDGKWMLRPNEQFTYSSKRKSYEIRPFNPDFRAIWRTGEIKFSETEMAMVFEVLRTQYQNLSLEFSDDRILKSEISGTFKTSDSIANILELICFSKDWELEKLGADIFKIKE